MIRPTAPAADPARLRPWVLPAALLAALVGFQLVFGLRLLWADDAYWSNPHGDMGQMLAGELAGLRAPWSVPILTPDTLLAPDRVSLVYTDSIPWLTALLKLTHLGRAFSLLGTFLLLAWLAQPAAMYALLRAAGVRRWETLLAGSLLALLVPAWLGRQIGHIALSGHAIQIAALALAVHAIRTGLSRRTAVVFTALGVLAVGVHAYHVPVVTLMLLAALASEALQRRPRALRRGAEAFGAYLACVVGAAWFVGYFVGRGASGGVDALGIYEMNLISPVFPQASALAGQRWTGGWFTHTFDPTGGQAFEGFNYLGAGVLLLMAAAAGALLRARRSRRAASTPAPASLETNGGWARRWGPLVAALAVCCIYALGTKPYVGSIRLFELPLPHAAWAEPLALFRCHGRFFWIVGYALLAGALVVSDRSLRPRTLAVLVTTALVLQAADMSQMLGGLNDLFSRSETLRVPAVLASSAFRGRDVRFFPGYFCTGSVLNHEVVRQMSLIAQRQGASTNSAETARPPVQGCAVAPPADALVDAAPGDRRITVLMSDDGAPSVVTTLFARRSDCRSVSSFWMCGRDLDSLPGATPVDGHTLTLTTHTDAALTVGEPAFAAALGGGWSKPEPTGVWSQAPHAVLRLPRPAAAPAGAVLSVTLDALGYQPGTRPAQRAFVSVGGRRLAEWRLDGGGYHGLRVTVPAALVPAAGPFELAFDFPDALSPNDVLPGSGDPRKLGIGVRKITLAH